MRIIQIIDSLEVGGAEKMAVNYANALAQKVAFSGLIATRKEGYLKEHINDNVVYEFLDRKTTLDRKALLRLRDFCIAHNITHIQAHSSSYFIATLLKLYLPKINIIWHDHNGLSEFLGKRMTYAVKVASTVFKGIISVNYQLKEWALRELHCKNVIFFANFTKFDSQVVPETILKGQPGKRILCLANLRVQKNHFLLIDVAEQLKMSHPDWTFHLVGKDFNDEYSNQVKKTVFQKKLEDTIFFYGTCKDTENIIKQADICILTSNSEGLPVALLEYGLCSKPFLSTKVGEIPHLIETYKNGVTVEVNDVEGYLRELVKFIEDQDFREKLGKNLFQYIQQNNSEEAIINNYITWLQEIE